MRKNLLYIFVFILQGVTAQSAEELFEAANKDYKEEKYEQAIKKYDSIEKLGFISSELFYNLGNSNYKLNKVAPSIYYYEKALLLDPLNEDARNNLIFARRLTIDNIEALPTTIFQKFDEAVLKQFSYNQWAIICVVFSFIISIAFLGYYFAYSSSRKRLYFISCAISFLFLILSLLATFKEYDESITKKEAIIFAQEIVIKNAPSQNAEDVFTLHEGTKVDVLDTVDEWKKIRIADGKIGWMPESQMKILQ